MPRSANGARLAAVTFLGILLLAGCTEKPGEAGVAQDQADAGRPATEKLPASENRTTSLVAADCISVNIGLPVPMSETDGLEPFEPVPADPLGATAVFEVWSIDCGYVAVDGLELGPQSWLQGMVAVEPLEGFQIDGADGYYTIWLFKADNGALRALADQIMVPSAFIDGSSVDVEPASLGEAQQATVQVSSGERIESAAAGPTEDVPRTFAGLYLANETHVAVHALDVGRHGRLASGAALVDPGPVPIPFLVRNPDGPVDAWHDRSFAASLAIGDVRAQS